MFVRESQKKEAWGKFLYIAKVHDHNHPNAPDHKPPTSIQSIASRPISYNVLLFQYELTHYVPILRCSKASSSQPNIPMFQSTDVQVQVDPMMFQWLLSPTATPGSGQPITGPSCSQQRRKVIAITSQDLHPACALIWASMTSRCGTNCQQKPIPHHR